MKRFCYVLMMLGTCGAIVQCNAQNASFTASKALSLKQAITSEMSPHKEDSYTIKMRKGQFASVRITEKNIRLIALVYDPADSLIQGVDENQMGNKEVVTLNATKTGTYKIMVRWGFTKPLNGSYTITLDKLEETGKTPALQVAQMFDSWYENEAPGAAVAVIKDNQVIFKRTKGLANMEEHLPIRENSVFEIASCSKQFAGLAIAMLVERKQIAMEDDIRKYLPEMPDYGDTITIAHLVYHTSGIRNTDVFEIAGYSPEDILTLPMIIKFAANQQHLKFKPGQQFSYSNTNYNLLAEIVARVTKQSFPAWTRENIFKPLGMHSTFFKENPGDLYKHKVLCYKGVKEGFVQRPNNYAAMGSAALCTTLDDLVRWVMSFNSRKLISGDIEKLLVTTGRLNDGSKTNYAFGNFVGPQGVEHLGLVIGYRAAIMRFHTPKLSVIYMSNDDNNATYRRYEKIKGLFLGIPEQIPDIKTLPSADDALKNLENETRQETDVNHDAYTGTYFSEELLSAMVIKKKNGRLVITHPRMSDLVLSHTKDDAFGFVQFSRDPSGRINSLKILGENVDFVKIK